jgi:hypothetical protein
MFEATAARSRSLRHLPLSRLSNLEGAATHATFKSEGRLRFAQDCNGKMEWQELQELQNGAETVQTYVRKNSLIPLPDGLG